MTTEEKAKAYDEVVNKLAHFMEQGVDPLITRADVKDFFPELKESEDERIRKALLEMVHDTTGDSLWVDYNVHKEDAIAWLEKQVDKPSSQSEFKVGDFVKDTNHHKQPIYKIVSIDKECYICESDDVTLGDKAVMHFAFDNPYLRLVEQKPTDKVEPKFYKGEWLCENEPNNYARFIQILEIVNVQGKERYRISRDIHNDKDVVEFDFVEKYYHKFDIKDAKDGDVLYLKHDGKEHIIIYKGVIKERFRTFVSAYCAYNGIVDAFCFADVSRYADIAYGGIMPATKEQRELLWQKMKEAGYMWDSDSKQLLSLKAEPNNEKKPAWSEEDENNLTDTCVAIRKFYHRNNGAQDLIDWLQSLKQRMKGE